MKYKQKLDHKNKAKAWVTTVTETLSERIQNKQWLQSLECPGLLLLYCFISLCKSFLGLSLIVGEKLCFSKISPSTLYALGCILENIPFINGSPQNTSVPGLIDLAIKKNSLIGGDDFKSGQTKMKSVLVDFLVGAGIKQTSIVSYNHLGNNDAMNLSTPQTFHSKEISKSNVVDDMVASNQILFEPGEHLDHVVVIKHVPYVADSKRAMDEYASEICMGGRNTIVMHKTCKDSFWLLPLFLIWLSLLSSVLVFNSRLKERKSDFK